MDTEQDNTIENTADIEAESMADNAEDSTIDNVMDTAVDDATDTAGHSCVLCGAVCEEPQALCAVCRDSCLRLRVPVWVYAFLALVCVGAAVLSMQLPTVMDTYKVYLQAERDLKDKRFGPALDGYITVLEKYDTSVPIIVNAVESAMGAQYFDGAAYILNTWLAGKELNDDQYEYAQDVSDFLDREYDTYDTCMGILSANADDPETARNELLALVGQPGFNQAYVYFLIANVSPEIQDQLAYLQLSTEQDARCTYTLAYYGNALRRAGDYETALKIYGEALARNACDAYAMRGIGVVEQLQGDTQRGLQTIQAAYDLNPNELYMSEALILALCECGQRDEAMAIMQTRQAEGYAYEQDLYDYLDGQITMAEYYSQ